MHSDESWFGKVKRLLVGESKSLTDQHIFHKISLVAVLAWVGLGADGLSSSCYGPEETFRLLHEHPALSLIIAFASITTIGVLCLSYAQIIELFPSGGGGYLVASKLVSPMAGVVSGAALIVDYVLTITISIAAGADALFSILPAEYMPWKVGFACGGIVFLTILNLRGVKESVLLCVPVFFVFLLTHVVAIFFGIISHGTELGGIAQSTVSDIRVTQLELGWIGLFVLLLKAYSMGAGTYTGIEAVSNGLQILREPRARTGKRTMLYMGVSLAVTVFGLMLAYLIYDVHHVQGKTMNTVLFEKMTVSWAAPWGSAFVWTSMISATLLLFIAAQAGFLDGPRVLSNMALDRWFPARFAVLSDRFVTQNGIVLMGVFAAIVLVISHGSVALLVVLYSINVFITFSLSQLGMVRHWWRERHNEKRWISKLAINGVGLGMCFFILVSLVVMKFWQGGWITLLVTGGVVAIAILVKRHYVQSTLTLKRLDTLVEVSATEVADETSVVPKNGRTAIVLVNGYNGLGLHTFWGIFRLFPKIFSRFIFVQVGVVDAGRFKGVEELEVLRRETEEGARKYVELATRLGFESESLSGVSHDMIGCVEELCEDILKRHPRAIVFSGQLSFQKETLWTRWLHNYAVFALQRVFCARGTAFVIVPIQV